MTQLAQMHQFHALRKMKVDHFTAQARRAMGEVHQAQEAHAAALAVVATAEDRARRDFDTLFHAASDISDPQTRLTSVNRTIVLQRQQLAQAQTQATTAAFTLRQCETTLAEINQHLSVAQGQLDAAKTQLENQIAALALKAEDAADEAALEQFSARATGDQQWAR